MDSSTIKDEVLGWLELLGAGLAVVAAVLAPQALALWLPAVYDLLGAVCLLAPLGGFAWFLTRR